MPQVGLESASVNIRFGKRKRRSQMCEVFTDDGRIVTVEHDVLRGCAVDNEKGSAFLLDGDNQFVAEDRQWTQVLGEKSMLPICLVKKTNVENLKILKNQIFHEAHEGAKNEQYAKAKQSALMDKILWIVLIPCITLLLIFAMQHFGG